MKTRNIVKGLSLFFAVLAFSSCKKESENIFTMFEDVKVTFEDRGPYAITENTVVNDGDSVNIYFTITSPNKEMYTVVVDSTNGEGGRALREIATQESERHAYSGVIRMKAQRDGKTTFRIFGLNEADVFVGDGYTSITVDVKASYRHLTNRKIYLHAWNEGRTTIDDVNGERKTFFSLETGEAFNYEEAAANSDKIDFGLYLRVDQADGPNKGRIVYNIYTMNAPTNPLPNLDISGWQKRNTLFSAPVEVANDIFVRELVSNSMLLEKAEEQDISLTYTDISTTNKGFDPGNLLYFKTPEGKFGAIYVNSLSKDAIGDYLSVAIKIQK